MTEEQQREFVDLKTKVAVMYEVLQQLKDQMREVNGHLTKLVWLVVGAIVMAFLQWVLKGGLNGVS